MTYGFNLKAISLDDLKVVLRTSYLIPSVRILLDGLDENIGILQTLGIRDLDHLYGQLKTKKKAGDMSDQTGIDLDYMVVLRRYVSSFIPKARKLKDYPDLDGSLLNKMEDLGIKHSLDLDKMLRNMTDQEASQVLTCKVSLVKGLRQVLEVSQLRYISPAFGTLLVRSGYDTIEKLSTTDPKSLPDAIKKTNQDQGIYKGNVGDSDAQFIIDDAKVYLMYRDK